MSEECCAGFPRKKLCCRECEQSHISKLESLLAEEQARGRRLREALEQIKNNPEEAFMNARIALVHDLAKAALQADEGCYERYDAWQESKRSTGGEK